MSSGWGDRGMGRGSGGGGFGQSRGGGGFDRPRGAGGRGGGPPIDDVESLPDRSIEELFAAAANPDSTSAIDFTKYDEIDVDIKGREPEKPMPTFDDIQLFNAIKRNVDRLGYTDPTPIQRWTIPQSLNGRDVMACAQTGSGKTAAFILPIMQCIINARKEEFEAGAGRSSKRRSPFDPIRPTALILAPTRELCRQIDEEARKFSHKSGLSSAVAYGGAPRGGQLQRMSRGCDLLVATPGRLNDFIQNGDVSMSKIRFLVLDEADRMLDMGFQPQIDDIVLMSDMPQKTERQTMVFSATFPREIQRLAAEYLNDFLEVTVGRVGSTTDLITQDIRWVDQWDKEEAVLDVVAADCKSAIVFCNTTRAVDNLTTSLYRQRIRAESVHGKKSQNARDRAVDSFKRGRAQVLVATDVAARGLDIPNVTHVINFDCPTNIDDYIHRIGRTGRAGKTGTAISFINMQQSDIARDLLQVLEEAKQNIPEELHKLATMRGGRGGGGGRGGRGGYRGRGGGGGGGYRGGGGGYGGGRGGGGGGGRGGDWGRPQRSRYESDGGWGQSADRGSFGRGGSFGRSGGGGGYASQGRGGYGSSGPGNDDTATLLAEISKLKQELNSSKGGSENVE